MAFGRKAAVGTALDREELEDLMRRMDVKLDEMKNATWELSKVITKASRVVETANAVALRLEAAARKTSR